VSTLEEVEICFASAHELARLLRARELTVSEAVAAHLARIERRNPHVNAYVHLLADDALATARVLQAELDEGRVRGPLHGVPIAIKDLEDIAGVPTTCGSRTMTDNVPARDAILVERLRAAGTIVLGKTNTPEFGHKGTTDNLVFGPTSSPFAIGTNAGGSSGGSAAAVADGLATIAQAGDGGGSIRIPAALCGVYGIKPSWGRVAHTYEPSAFLFTPLAQHGPIARTVRDAAIALAAMVGPHPRDPLSLPDEGLDLVGACDRPIEGLRVAYSRDLGGFPIDARVRAVVDNAVTALRDAGAIVEPVELRFGHPHEQLTEIWRRGISVHLGQMVAAMRADGRDLLALGADGLEPAIHKYLALGEALGAVDYKLDDLVRTHVFHAVQDVFDDYDLIVSPTLSVPAIENSDDGQTAGPAEVDGQAVDPLLGWCPTFLFNFTGHPAASVPAGLTAEGHPVGMQIVGPRLRDDLVLAASAAFEAVRPWARTYPGLREAAQPA
jgi:Asp-tRNA(Asn)/Glu-tRNA(Gln) amidotransferase A subunit family amidase